MRTTKAALTLAAVLIAAGSVPAASPPAEFQSGNDYADDYVVPAYSQTVTYVTGGGTATLSGFWNAMRDCKSLWKAEGSNLYVDANASFNNNRWTSGEMIYAANFQIEGTAANTGASNEVFEFDVGYDADQGSGTIGALSGNDIAGGMTSMRVHNARLVTHASQNLPTSFKHSHDSSYIYPSGATHESHHGLLIFSDIYSFGGTPKDSPATSNEWYVRSNDQTYDGGLYWRNDWKLDIEAGVTLSSNTAWEQNAVGVHVGFGTRKDNTNTTLTKTGEGALVIARGGIQGYEHGTTLDIQTGRVEFNSNEGLELPNYYAGGRGQTLQIVQDAGAEVDFHAYTWPIDWNPHWGGADYGPESLHEIKSLNAAGTVKVGGLWSPSSDAWDQAYQVVLSNQTPETAEACEAKLDVADDLTLHGTSTLQLLLGSACASESWQVKVGGLFTQTGTLEILDDGTLGIGTYPLFEAGSVSGSFDELVLPEAFQGSFNADSGQLEITAVPEPTTLVLTALAGLGLLRRRKYFLKT